MDTLQGRLLVLAAFGIFCSNVAADCAVSGFRGEVPKNPVYRVVSCQHAQSTVESNRSRDPGWYGEIEYSESDAVVMVTYENNDAQKTMAGKDFQHWYYPQGCSSLDDGHLLGEVELEFLCCDLGPVQSVQCGLGGLKLIEFDEGHVDQRHE